jgi:Zinc finger, C3HC4 type (RING finger)
LSFIVLLFFPSLEMAFTMQIPTHTAILPIGFTALPGICEELRIIPNSRLEEYSNKEWELFCRQTRCVLVNGSVAAWMRANPMPNWSITFQSNEAIYGTEYWVDYEPDGLLEYLRLRTNEYDLIYKRDNIPIFTLHVNHFQESGTWYVRIDTIWHSIEEPPVATPATSALIGLCAVCLEDEVSLVKWRTCSHAFCRDCTSRWRRTQDTCPLCRTPL